MCIDFECSKPKTDSSKRPPYVPNVHRKYGLPIISGFLSGEKLLKAGETVRSQHRIMSIKTWMEAETLTMWELSSVGMPVAAWSSGEKGPGPMRQAYTGKEVLQEGQGKHFPSSALEKLSVSPRTLGPLVWVPAVPLAPAVSE